jgi:hypothetical protein
MSVFEELQAHQQSSVYKDVKEALDTVVRPGRRVDVRSTSTPGHPETVLGNGPCTIKLPGFSSRDSLKETLRRNNLPVRSRSDISRGRRYVAGHEGVHCNEKPSLQGLRSAHEDHIGENVADATITLVERLRELKRNGNDAGAREYFSRVENQRGHRAKDPEHMTSSSIRAAMDYPAGKLITMTEDQVRALGRKIGTQNAMSYKNFHREKMARSAT